MTPATPGTLLRRVEFDLLFDCRVNAVNMADSQLVHRADLAQGAVVDHADAVAYFLDLRKDMR